MTSLLALMVAAAVLAFRKLPSPIEASVILSVIVILEKLSRLVRVYQLRSGSYVGSRSRTSRIDIQPGGGARTIETDEYSSLVSRESRGTCATDDTRLGSGGNSRVSHGVVVESDTIHHILITSHIERRRRDSHLFFLRNGEPSLTPQINY